MKSIILRTASTYLLPILLLFSIFILLRGHYYPGGGFVGGLIASIAFVLHGFTNGVDSTLRLMPMHPGVLIPFGLGFSTISMFLPVFWGQPVMTSMWLPMKIPVLGMVGTTLLFDVGIYFVVIGVVLTILFSISQYTE